MSSVFHQSRLASIYASCQNPKENIGVKYFRLRSFHKIYVAQIASFIFSSAFRLSQVVISCQVLNYFHSHLPYIFSTFLKACAKQSHKLRIACIHTHARALARSTQLVCDTEVMLLKSVYDITVTLLRYVITVTSFKHHIFRNFILF